MVEEVEFSANKVADMLQVAVKASVVDPWEAVILLVAAKASVVPLVVDMLKVEDKEWEVDTNKVAAKLSVANLAAELTLLVVDPWEVDINKVVNLVDISKVNQLHFASKPRRADITGIGSFTVSCKTPSFKKTKNKKSLSSFLKGMGERSRCSLPLLCR